MCTRTGIGSLALALYCTTHNEWLQASPGDRACLASGSIVVARHAMWPSMRKVHVNNLNEFVLQAREEFVAYDNMSVNPDECAQTSTHPLQAACPRTCWRTSCTMLIRRTAVVFRRLAGMEYDLLIRCVKRGRSARRPLTEQKSSTV